MTAPAIDPGTSELPCRRDQRPRAANDFYAEPRWAVDALLDVEIFKPDILDPACGSGNIVEACRARGLNAWGTDLVDRCGQKYGCSGSDFTAPIPDHCRGNVGSIICNPPFRHTEVFIVRALALARHKVAMLARLAFLEGAGRRERLFALTPPTRIWVFSRRVSMPPGGQGIEAKGGSVAYCWLVWEWGSTGAPILGWLP